MIILSLISSEFRNQGLSALALLVQHVVGFAAVDGYCLSLYASNF